MQQSRRSPVRQLPLRPSPCRSHPGFHVASQRPARVSKRTDEGRGQTAFSPKRPARKARLSESRRWLLPIRPGRFERSGTMAEPDENRSSVSNDAGGSQPRPSVRLQRDELEPCVFVSVSEEERRKNAGTGPGGQYRLKRIARGDPGSIRRREEACSRTPIRFQTAPGRPGHGSVGRRRAGIAMVSSPPSSVGEVMDRVSPSMA